MEERSRELTETKQKAKESELQKDSEIKSLKLQLKTAESQQNTLRTLCKV